MEPSSFRLRNGWIYRCWIIRLLRERSLLSMDFPRGWTRWKFLYFPLSTGMVISSTEDWICAIPLRGESWPTSVTFFIWPLVMCGRKALLWHMRILCIHVRVLIRKGWSVSCLLLWLMEVWRRSMSITLRLFLISIIGYINIGMCMQKVLTN